MFINRTVVCFSIALLTPLQIEKYQRLRGYEADREQGHVPRPH